MNRPPLFYFVIGHGLAVAAAFVAMALAVALWRAANASAILPLGAVMACLWAGRARAQVIRYRQWHRQWDALAPNPAPAHTCPQTETAITPQQNTPWRRVLWVFTIVCWFLLAAIAKTPDQKALLVVMALLMVAYLGFVLILRLLRRKRPALASARSRSADDTLVSQCITHSLYVVPSLGEAYHHLPEYCLQTLQIGGR